MSFGLKNIPATFQRAIMYVFVEYFNDFIQVFLENFSEYDSSQIFAAFTKVPSKVLKIWN